MTHDQIGCKLRWWRRSVAARSRRAAFGEGESGFLRLAQGPGIDTF